MVGGDDIAENPGAPLGTTPDADAVAACALQHGQGIGGLEDVAVTKDGDVEQVLQACNFVPVGLARVVLVLRARVQGERGGAELLRAQGGVRRGLVLGVDADTDLDGHGDLATRALPGLVAGAHDGAHKVREQVALPGQGRSPALLRHLGDGAPEVQVDVVGEVALDEHRRGLRHDGGVDAVELQGAHALGGVGAHHFQGALILLDEGAAGHHLGDVQAGGRVHARDGDVARFARTIARGLRGRGCGPLPRFSGPGGDAGRSQVVGQARLAHDAAQASEGHVRHPGHGGQDDGCPQAQRPHAKRGRCGC